MTLFTVAGCRYLWRFSIASVLLVLCIENPLPAQCVAANGDSSFSQDTGTNTPQFPGDRKFFFCISRVVGPGVASEYVPEGDPDPTKRGASVNWDAHQQNGVVSKTAHPQFSGTIAVGAQFWGYMTLNGNLNGDPAAAAVKFRYSVDLAMESPLSSLFAAPQSDLDPTERE